MPVVRISNKTMERLASWAEPPGGGMESAIDKALEAAERSRERPAEGLRASCSPATASRPERDRAALSFAEFCRLLLETLYSLGGRARPDEMRPRMDARMKAVAGPENRAASANGAPRWREALRRARTELEPGGYILNGSPPGIWELSKRGEDWAKAWTSTRNLNFIEYLAAMPDAGKDEDFDRHAGSPPG